MTETRTVNGHEIEVGEEFDGMGMRVLLDGEDVTDEVLEALGPPPEDGHGMKMPRGKSYVADLMERRIRQETDD